MKNDLGQVIIRKAARDDVRQIAEILVEDWKTAYRGIIDSDYLEAMNVEERYQRELQRYPVYTVAAAGNEVLGFSWNDMTGSDDADCEIVALYVKYAKRKRGIGSALFRNAMDSFKASGKKSMILWCLKENTDARRFYERMGGKAYKTGTHPWGNKDYEMIAYLYTLEG